MSNAITNSEELSGVIGNNSNLEKQTIDDFYSDNDTEGDNAEELDTSVTSIIKPSTYTKLMQFARSCTINLLLPFINGLMLGFGELVAHEVSWRYNWFDRRNVKAFKIEPESRKYAGLDTGRSDAVESRRDGMISRRLNIL